MTARRNSIPAVVAGLGLAVLAGCSSPAAGGSDEHAPSLPPSQQQAAKHSGPATTAKQNERGNVVKTAGQQFTITTDGKTAARVVIDKLTPGFDCASAYTEAAENGTYLGLSMRVSVASRAPQMATFNVLNPNDFEVLKPDGVTATNTASMNAATCLNDREQLPDEYQPGSKYTGTMVLDSPTKHGTLVFRPSGVQHGAEWKF